jgi:hypothetical protein
MKENSQEKSSENWNKKKQQYFSNRKDYFWSFSSHRGIKKILYQMLAMIESTWLVGILYCTHLSTLLCVWNFQS